jgi:hypothetical protein
MLDGSPDLATALIGLLAAAAIALTAAAASGWLDGG